MSTSRADVLAQEVPVSAGRSIPSMSAPDLTVEERDALLRVFSSGRLSLGGETPGFEEALAKYVGAPYAVAVNSGTSALHLAAIAADIGRDDLAITSPFSFVASSNCILYQDGIPVFADVDPGTGNICPTSVCSIAEDIRSGSQAGKLALPPYARNLWSKAARDRLKAVIPVHVFGVPADLDPILEVASRRSLVVIEDACEAIGAEYKSRRVGTFGDAGIFAFYPNKQITTGEGGAIVTRLDQWSRLFQSLRNQGRDVSSDWLSHDLLGYNYRLDELSAALGRVQLRRAETLLEKRATVARWYSDRLRDVAGLSVWDDPEYMTRKSWFVYTIRLDPHIDRNEVMAQLKERRVESRAYFPPIHLQPFYRKKFGFTEGSFPVTEDLGRRTLALPFSGIASEEEVDYVCDILQDALKLYA